MSKNIFDEAMNTHLPKIVNQANERKLNNEVVVNRWGLETIEKALKLGKLYKELSNYVDEDSYAHKLPEITRLKILIKELENE